MPCQPDFQISVSLQTAFTHLIRRLQRSFPGIQIIRVKNTRFHPGLPAPGKNGSSFDYPSTPGRRHGQALFRTFGAEKKIQKQFGFSLWTQHPD